MESRSPLRSVLGVITATGLSKRYGSTLAVDDVSFDVRPGLVTGFLGPNGAGKSTTMRMVLGLDRPTAGTATVHGVAYRELPRPMRSVGALLDAGAVHGGRTGHRHLSWLARAGGIPPSRVDDVLSVVGLEHAAGRKVRGYSLGMKQRLGLAAALLGDPETLVLDEPVNGMDPDGIRQVRTLLRGLAAEGRTVLVSSHLMAEMQETADHVLVINRGRIVADGPLAELTRRAGGGRTRVVSPDADLAGVLTRAGATVTSVADGVLEVSGLDTARVGDLAAAAGLRLHELTPLQESLETAFFDLIAAEQS
jgi:ABC-2 type transport system ATP-binding protein